MMVRRIRQVPAFTDPRVWLDHNAVPNIRDDYDCSLFFTTLSQ
jgi:hypothetical protein